MGVLRPAAAVDVALRASMLVMLARVLRARPDDHRFVGKGIGVRFTAVALPATMFVPAVWAAARVRDRRVPYPAGVDALYVSLFALDLAGNVFDWYDSYKHFDLIPHAHGGGAIAVLFAWLFRMPVPDAVRWSIAGHVLLEAQEIASDKIFGLRNVRGWWDVAGDIGAGVAGAVAYGAAYRRLIRDAGREAPSPLRG
ncbi:MAG TPA: hypothetical protein VFV72_09420 [Candidatus Limnocylindrales bacterium]|nr:hypothetical protein [Candidatus Limnocylindrales bacterium]